MTEIIEVKSRKPVIEAVTVKFDRYEALEVIDLLDSAWKRNNYHFRFDGKPSFMYTTLYTAVHGEAPKPKAKQQTASGLDYTAFLR